MTARFGQALEMVTHSFLLNGACGFRKLGRLPDIQDCGFKEIQLGNRHAKKGEGNDDVTLVGAAFFIMAAVRRYWHINYL